MSNTSSNRSHLNKSTLFATFSLLFSIIPVVGLAFAFIGFYQASMVDTTSNKALKAKKNVRLLFLAIASLVCVAVAVYWYRQYIDAMEIKRLLSHYGHYCA